MPVPPVSDARYQYLIQAAFLQACLCDPAAAFLPVLQVALCLPVGLRAIWRASSALALPLGGAGASCRSAVLLRAGCPSGDPLGFPVRLHGCGSALLRSFFLPRMVSRGLPLS